ncbi:hypothetical protein SO802_028462 [Lithocarpus litseifolius]|uniref:Uncharacterized protein n=1 Tax=Lithocarpus litseifolius TaxID=425828 RepID=A0AAW2BRD8_9ROSI
MLGEGSWGSGLACSMLKRLLTDLEVKNIMNAEMLCKVNQVPPELVFVNGETLSKDELFNYKTANTYPPKKLRPGYYWYDKYSGFWGKEGQKPSQIITSHLDVGGHIKRNTNVLINNREITKEELWMIKTVGVHCEGPPNLWESKDGTYQEEANKKGKRKIWEKVLDDDSGRDDQKTFISLLSPSLCSSLQNLYYGDTIQIHDTTIYSVGARVRTFSDWLLQVLLSDNLEAIFPAATCEYAPFVEEMWKDAAIQATYNWRNELQMLPRAVEISRRDYEPSDMDILYADRITSSNSLTCMEFSFPKSTQDDSPDPAYRHDSSLRHDMFEDTDIVLFCVASSDYDEYSVDRNGVLTNKMLASKELFESIVTHPTFENKNFLLILNKFDLLEEKIKQVPLTQCEWFRDFKPVVSPNCQPELSQHASH